MRSLSLLSLVVVLLVVAVLVKKQLGVVQAPTSAASTASDVAVRPNLSTPQQVQTDVNNMMQNRSGQLDQELGNKQP